MSPIFLNSVFIRFTSILLWYIQLKHPVTLSGSFDTRKCALITLFYYYRSPLMLCPWYLSSPLDRNLVLTALSLPPYPIPRSLQPVARSPNPEPVASLQQHVAAHARRVIPCAGSGLLLSGIRANIIMQVRCTPNAHYNKRSLCTVHAVSYKFLIESSLIKCTAVCRNLFEIRTDGEKLTL